jgi:hypothetical protein
LDAAHILDPSNFNSEDLSQLWQVHVEAQRLCLGPGLQLHGPLLAAAEAATRNQVQQNCLQKASNMQAEVEKALIQMHQDPSTLPGGSRIAIASTPKVEYVVESSPVTTGGVQPDKWLVGVDCVVEVVWTSGEDGRQQSTKVAVEVDGPTHFMANKPHSRSYDGPTQLRNRWLSHAFGGQLVVVPYWEWYALNGTTRIAYLTNKMEAMVSEWGSGRCLN